MESNERFKSMLSDIYDLYRLLLSEELKKPYSSFDRSVATECLDRMKICYTYMNDPQKDYDAFDKMKDYLININPLDYDGLQVHLKKVSKEYDKRQD